MEDKQLKQKMKIMKKVILFAANAVMLLGLVSLVIAVVNPYTALLILPILGIVKVARNVYEAVSHD